MVAAFDYCLWGKGGAAPSIDTAMHGLVDAAHVDHLHPDAGIALAAAADGEALTKACFGDRVAWVPWRRPGFQLGLDIARVKREHPAAIGVILGGHGITAWGATSGECEARSLEIIGTAQRFLDEHGQGRAVRSPAQRAAAGAGAARPGGGAGPADPRPGLDRPQADRALHRLPRRARLPVPGQAPGAGRARHLVPGSLPAHQGAADAARPAAGRLRRGGRGPAARAARGLPGGLPRLLRTVRGRLLAADARRGPGHRAGAGRRDVQLRRGRADRAGGGRVLPERDQRDARRRGGLRLPADPGEREVPHRVLGARGGQAAPPAQAEAAGRADRAGHRGRFRHRPGHRAAARRRGRLRGGGRPRRRGGPDGGRRDRRRRAWLAGRGHGGDRGRDRRGRGGGRVRRGRAGLRRRGPGGQQRGPVHLQAAARDDPGRLGPAARRDGPRLVPGLPPGRQGHDGPGDGRRHRLHLQQERGLRRAVQRGLRRGQGRPGAPGPAAGRRARRHRRPGERHQPGRRGARLGDLRLRLGGAAGGGLRRARGRARRVLRPADPAQARGPARARGRGGARAVRRRPAADHRPAHPGRRGGGGRVPRDDQRHRRGGRPGRLRRPGDGRTGRRRGRASCTRCTGSPTSR